MMKRLTCVQFAVFLTLFTGLAAWAKVDSLAAAKAGKKPSLIVLFTAHPADKAEEAENLTDVSRFAMDQYDAENNVKTDVNLIAVDDKDNPQEALIDLKKI